MLVRVLWGLEQTLYHIGGVVLLLGRLLALAAAVAYLPVVYLVLWYANTTDPRIAVAGTPLLFLACLIAMDDPPESEVRIAGLRVFWSMVWALVAGAVVGGFWPGAESRILMIGWGALNGALIAGLLVGPTVAFTAARRVRRSRRPRDRRRIPDPRSFAPLRNR